eukprot:1136735-Pelagomonas_calceolata.AAC.1
MDHHRQLGLGGGSRYVPGPAAPEKNLGVEPQVYIKHTQVSVGTLEGSAVGRVHKILVKDL